WIRLALYQYSSPLATGADTRAAVLNRQAPTIATYQDTCNSYNQMFGKPPANDLDPNPKAAKPHQTRQCYILNQMGNQQVILKKLDAALRATDDSLEAAKFKADNPDAWPVFGQEIMTPDAFHVLLLKGK